MRAICLLTPLSLLVGCSGPATPPVPTPSIGTPAIVDTEAPTPTQTEPEVTATQTAATPSAAGPTPTVEVTEAPTPTRTPLPSVSSPLFFAQYIEGTGNNKALEIKNPGGVRIELDTHAVVVGANGEPLEGSPLVLELTGALDPGESLIVCNPEADAALKARCDVLTVDGTTFNGDDAVALQHLGRVIDIIGVDQERPASGWDVAGTDTATRNHTLVRKPEVVQGTTNWLNSAGTDADNSQWVVHPEDYFEALGAPAEGTPTPTATPGPTAAPGTRLYFSEYVEGSGSNRAFELHNPTAEAADLAEYEITLGAAEPSGGQASNTLRLSGSLPAGSTWVVCNTLLDVSALDTCDVVSNKVTQFTGDDALRLFHSGTLVDTIGLTTDDPGFGWDVAGVAGATADHTLRRKASIASGNTNWYLSAGTTAENSEWQVLPQDTLSGLGAR